jgi:hypothetical protein
MRDDADFAAYVAARWPFLVRSLVLIGCPRAEAEDVVVTGLARCYPSYDRVRGTDDIDAHVYGTVLDGWHRTLRHRGESRDEDREVQVLRAVAGLSEFQVAEVLDVSLGIASRPTSSEDLRGAAEAVEVTPAPYDAVIARYGELRRRRRRIAVIAVAASALVIAGLVVVSVWAGPEPEERPEVVEAQNPIALPWYGGGLLQLRDVAVELPQVAQVVSAAGGAVFVDEEGEVAFAGADGRVTELDRTPAGSPVVASDERSWVAWVSSDEEPELVVHDVIDEREVARVGVPPGTRLVALDQNRVFYVSEDRTHVWEPLTGRVEDLGSQELLDIESAVRVYGDGTSIDMVQPFFNVHFSRSGATAELSSGGTFVLTRPGDDLEHAPVIYDARSGNEMPSGLAPGELALDAAFGPSGTIEYLVVTSADAEIAVLRSCHLGTTDCTDIVPLDRADLEPRLAH